MGLCILDIVLEGGHILRMYEALFIVDSALAGTDLDNVQKGIHDILQKNGANILKTDNLGEKKLAYRINGHKRGTYLLVHFNAESSSLATIRRDFQLSDDIVRFLIVKDDTIEDLSQIAAEQEVAEKEIEEITQDLPGELLEEDKEALKIGDE